MAKAKKTSAAAPAPEGSVRVRVLCDTWIEGKLVKADAVVDLPVAVYEAQLEFGAVDADPAAVAYAESLTDASSGEDKALEG